MNTLNLESQIRAFPKTSAAGIVRDYPIALGQLTLDAGTTIPAAGSGIVGRTNAATALRVIAWNATADNGDIIALDWTLPRQFHPSSVSEVSGTTLAVNTRRRRCSLRLRLKMRLTDLTGSATANADLKVQVTALWHNVGDTSLNTLASAVEQTVGATDYADAAEEGFVWYEFDITGAMTEVKRNALTPGATFQISINPHEAIGTNLRLDLAGALVSVVEHLTLWDPDVRNPT